MEQNKMYNEISSLPLEAQRQVTDFIALLRTRYKKRSQIAKTVNGNNILNEPFIGIWKDRDNMKDSNQWVRNIRRSEWGLNKLI